MYKNDKFNFRMGNNKNRLNTILPPQFEIKGENWFWIEQISCDCEALNFSTKTIGKIVCEHYFSHNVFNIRYISIVFLFTNICYVFLIH